MALRNPPVGRDLLRRALVTISPGVLAEFEPGVEGRELVPVAFSKENKNVIMSCSHNITKGTLDTCVQKLELPVQLFAHNLSAQLEDSKQNYLHSNINGTKYIFMVNHSYILMRTCCLPIRQGCCNLL